METSQSHDPGHCECTDNSLGWGILGKLAGKILNVLEMYRVGTSWVHCPFPCDVFAMYRVGTPPLAPCARWSVAFALLTRFVGEYREQKFPVEFPLTLGSQRIPCP